MKECTFDIGGYMKRKKEKFVGNIPEGLSSFNPSVFQREFLDIVEYSGHDIIFTDSHAGTGKTTAALYYAFKQLCTNPHMKLVLVRTPAEMGKDRIGFLPGEANLQDKLGPHFESAMKISKEMYGTNKFECDLDKKIFFTVPNYALGVTREDCIYIIDEAQLLEPLILKLLLERIGKGTKTIVLGSSSQLYADDKTGRNALRDAYKRFFNEDGTQKYNNIVKYTFPIDAVMRHDVVKTVIEAYDKEV